MRIWWEFLRNLRPRKGYQILFDLEGYIFSLWVHQPKLIMKYLMLILGEGLKQNINKIRGIFHGGLTPPIDGKSIRTLYNVLKMSFIGSSKEDFC